ncbi:TniB protein [Aneurinibacillus soli]|uniref:Transposon Tn7 transposition protein TnsC n=1 Tax=Aneurinibacillus soli TaxID=1500254 RepID=A0A0U4WN89_9BACL|nr:ATP-binding protein [Aneurinibacillus soli]PYE61907.1 TniB protein [Aneurinibacillus soli]BAU29723.1 Transposon Tn7 transposition protein TnsC [Aneurinibacillus soli]
MMNRIFMDNGMEATEASYNEFPLEEYNSNPFIQTLPPLMNKQTIIKNLMLPISFNVEERNWDGSYRLHMIQRLYKLFQPLPIHVDIWNVIFSLLYQGYIARNPFDKEYRGYINETGKRIINRSFDINSRSNFRTTASCATLIGYSGMGKTTTVNRILSNIPQIIVHNHYNDQHFNQIQLSHLTLQTPHNSSLKALTLQFFMKVDELLGTNTFQKHVSRNLSTDAMLPLMGQVAHNIGLGMLVIDEIQHLQNRGVQQMMNYFVTLMNSFGVPVLFIGTPASYAIFQNEFRIARRVSGNGEIIWNNMENGKEFRFLLESIWKYQWNQKFTPLNEELIKVFYEETQGVSDLIVKLFVNVQMMAISSGKEEFTADMVNKVAKEQFKLMKPMLEAIKSKNPYKMVQYEDLRRVELSEGTAQKKDNSIPNAKKINKVAQELKQKQIRIPKTTIVPKESKAKNIDYSEDDLRSLLKQASKSERSAYQILLEKGYIDNMRIWQEGVVK